MKLKTQRKKPGLLRRILLGALLLMGLVAAIHLVSAFTLDSAIEYVEETVLSPKIPPALEGYRIAFLTDIHGASEKKLAGIVEEVGAWQPDLILFGGDFSGQKSLSDCFGILSAIEAPDGFFGVEGNHDAADTLREAMESWEMELLENDGIRVRDGLYIAGVEDLWNRVPDINAALQSAHPEDFVLLLAHNPDVSMRHDLSGVDLTLSGHTHGGEVTLFGLWGPAMGFVSDYGQRFRTGWCKSAADTDVLVSNGIQSHFFIRVFARPQVLLLTLEGPAPSQ